MLVEASNGYIYTKNNVTPEDDVAFMLSYADSNHDKQNQNLLCYHYTIGQSWFDN